MVANRIEGDGELINDGHSMGGVSCENGFQHRNRRLQQYST